MSGLKLFPYFRPKDSNTASTCSDFQYKEDWADQTDGSVVGGFKCDDQSFEIVKDRTGYKIEKDGKVVYSNLSADSDVYILVDGSNGTVKKAASEKEAVDYFETKRKPEVAKTETSTVTLKTGDLLRAGVSVGYSNAAETTPLPKGLQGETQSHDGFEMNGVAVAAEVKAFPFRLIDNPYAANWLGIISTELDGGVTFGWLNDHYTADKGNSGNYQIGKVGLRLGVELPFRGFWGQLFTGNMGKYPDVDWDIYLYASWELLGYEWLKGNWAHSGGSLPKEVDEHTWRSMFVGDVTHKAGIGVKFLEHWNVGLEYLHADGIGRGTDEDDRGKPEINNRTISLKAAYTWGGSSKSTTTTTVEGDNTVRLVKQDPTIEEAPPAAVEVDALPSQPLPDPIPAIPEKHVAKAHEPIFIPAALKFKQGTGDLLEGEAPKLDKVITDIAAAINEEYPGGVPEGYVLYLTAVGKASPEASVKNNKSVSNVRAKPTADLLFDKLNELKQKGTEPFKGLVIEKTNFTATGAGETELVRMDGDKVVEVKRPYGGYENDKANWRPANGNVYKICVGSTDPKISHTRCKTPNEVIDVDMELNRRVDIKIDIGPAKAVEEASIPAVGAGVDKIAAEKIVSGIKGSKLFKTLQGFKEVRYDEKDNEIVIVLNKQGYENREKIMKGYTHKGKKIPGLYDVVKGINGKPGSKLTDGCIIRFAAFLPGKDVDRDAVFNALKATFYDFNNWTPTFGSALQAFSVIQAEYDKGKTAAAIREAKEKDMVTMNFGTEPEMNIEGYKVRYITVGDFAKPTLAEMKGLEFHVREMSQGGNKVSLYIVSKTGPDKPSAKRIVEGTRRVNTNISNYFTAAEPNAGDANYIIIISGTDEPDLSLPDDAKMVAIRKAIMNQVFGVK